MLALAKRLVRDTIGEMPARDAVLRLRSAPAIVRRYRFELAETERLLAQLGTRPSALVATVIPTYRRPELLARAVRSALDQTVEDNVVVVVSDGAEVEVPFTHPRLHVLRLSQNTRLPAVVRNIGMRITDSRYCALLDDDNEWFPNHLEVSLATLGGGADVCYSGIQRVLPDGRVYDELAVPFDRRLLRNDNFVDANTLVWRRERRLYQSRASRTKGQLPFEDWELGWRASRKGALAFTGQVTARYLVNPNSFYWQEWAEQIRQEVDARESPQHPEPGPDTAPRAPGDT